MVHIVPTVRVQAPSGVDYLAVETLHILARRHDLSRNLIRIWIQKLKLAASPMRRPPRSRSRLEARIAALDTSLADTPGDRVSKGGPGARNAAEKRDYIRRYRPRAISVAGGCRLMGIARSIYCDKPAMSIEDTAIVETMRRSPTSSRPVAISRCKRHCVTVASS